MKKIIFCLLIATTTHAADFKHRVFNFIQFKAEKGEGVTTNANSKDKPIFGFDRVWLGYIIKKGNLNGLAIAGINKSGDTSTSKLNDIPDSLIITRITYDFSDKHRLKFGLDWSPMTLGNKTPGWKLDLPKRTMEVALSFHQLVGVSYKFNSDNKLIPSVEVGMYEPPARSGAVNQGTKGRQVAYAIAADWNFGGNLLSIFSGKAEEAGGDFTDDYLVSGLSLKHHIKELFEVQLEHINGKGILGVEAREQSISWFQFAYNHSDNYQGIIKYMSGTSTNGSETKLNNLYIGLNYFVKPTEEDSRMKSRFQVAYVQATGDKDTWNGLSGYTGNAILTQFQLRFN